MSNGYGVLFLHGLFGSPEIFAELHRQLQNSGFHCSAPTLAGHESPLSLAKTSLRDHLALAEKKLNELSVIAPKGVFVVGFSLGGCLAVALSKTHPTIVKGLVLLSTPAKTGWLEKAAVSVLRLWPWALPMLPADKTLPVSKIGGHRQWYTRSLAPYLQAVERTARTLPAVAGPTMVIGGKQDRVIGPSNAQFVFENLGSRDKRILLLEGGHFILQEIDWPLATKSIIDFVAKHAV